MGGFRRFTTQQPPHSSKNYSWYGDLQKACQRSASAARSSHRERDQGEEANQ
jgi:hypothetical protein